MRGLWKLALTLIILLTVDNQRYSNFYENVTFLRNLVNFRELISKRITNRNAAA
jgi:hypothetical protein